MQMIHSSPAWEPDLTSPAQLAQAEQNWPGLGASDSDLAAWARLYGTAALDFAADQVGVDADKSWTEGYNEAEKEAVDTINDLERTINDLKAETDGDMSALDCLRGASQAVAYAMEQMAEMMPPAWQDEILTLAGRLRDGV